MNFYKGFLLVLIAFLIAGCSHKTTIKALKAPKVSDSSIKNIGVVNFKKDYIAQASQIDTEISKVIINGKEYFNLVDRQNLKRVLKEKKLNDSGLVRLVKGYRNKGLAQVQSLVTGQVNVSDLSSSTFYEKRTDYSRCSKYKYVEIKGKKRKYCVKYRTYKIRCKANTYSVSTKVKVIRVADAKTIFSNTYSKSSKLKRCRDSKNVLPSKKVQNTKLAAIIARDFIKDIAPSYIYLETKLLDKADIDYTSREEKMLETSIKLIENKRIQKANDLLKRLNESTKNRSYVALYNYGVTQESLGDLQNALKYYTKAEDIAILEDGLNEDISKAIVRVEKNILELKKANKLLK